LLKVFIDIKILKIWCDELIRNWYSILVRAEEKGRVNKELRREWSDKQKDTKWRGLLE